MKTVPLHSILFDIFGEDGRYAKFQLPEHVWAVAEALNRVQLSRQPLWDWDVVEARKEHRCWGGCAIKPGEKYYTPGKYTTDEEAYSVLNSIPFLTRTLPIPIHRLGEHDAVKLCVRCEATLWRENDTSWACWTIRKANKDHECSRGCAIRAGDFYFIHSGGGSDGMKMCARCMAMVLYFKNVDGLSAYRYSGWDWEHQEPARVHKPAMTGTLDGYWFPATTS
jgi:hypothetical protein